MARRSDQAAQPTVGTAHLGLGPIGLAALRSVLARPGTRVMGAVDLRPEFLGRDVGELAGVARIGVPVVASLSELGAPPDVVVHCTGSRLTREVDRILEAVALGASVVSTCEELAYPWFHHPEEAARIDEAARAAGRTVVATGVNPGFAMDALALCLSAVTERIETVEIHRVVDAATRRGPLQQKVGAGISPEEFAERRRQGTIGHVGLVESVAMIAGGLGWPLDRIDEDLQPVVAVSARRTEHVTVDRGRIAGIRQVATGYEGARVRIRLELEMFVGAVAPGDAITLVGEPTIRARIDGIHGDVATAAIVANTVAALPRVRPGLLTALDLVALRLA